MKCKACGTEVERVWSFANVEILIEGPGAYGKDPLHTVFARSGRFVYTVDPKKTKETELYKPHKCPSRAPGNTPSMT